MTNGSVTPREEGFAKQTHVMLLGGWSADDVTAKAYPVLIKLEALLRRYSWKKVLQNYSRISYGLNGRWRMSRNHEVISGSAACFIGAHDEILSCQMNTAVLNLVLEHRIYSCVHSCTTAVLVPTSRYL